MKYSVAAPLSWLISALCSYARRHFARVPVVLQTTNTECGAACLTMILAYWGYQSHLAEWRSHFGIGRDGIGARQLMQAARARGLLSRAYRAEPSDLATIPVPAIIHWEFNHYVVLESVTSTRATIIDPAVGRRHVTVAELDASFTGVVITFERSASFQKRHLPKQRTWHGFFRHIIRMSGSKYLFLQLIIVSLIIQGIGLGLAMFTKILVDNVLMLKTPDAARTLTCAFLVLTALQIAMSALRALLIAKLQIGIDTYFVAAIVKHLLSLPLAYFRQRAVGDILMRISSSTSLRDMLISNFVSMFLDLLISVVYILVLFHTWPTVALLTLLLIVAQLCVVIVSSPIMRRLAGREFNTSSQTQSSLVDVFRGIATIKSSRAESDAYTRWHQNFVQQLDTSARRSIFSAFASSVTSGMRTASPLLILSFCVPHAINGDMSLGTMLAISSIAVGALTPATSLLGSIQSLQTASIYLQRIDDILLEAPECGDAGDEQVILHGGQIAMHNVSVGYEGNESKVLHDVSLFIASGEHVAVVGRSGSGKSTLAMTLLGLITRSTGLIEVGGVPLTPETSGAIRAQCGVMLQEPYIFRGTVRQNIEFGNASVIWDHVVLAAKLADIYEDVVAMPMGFETLIEEGGTGLSGGQRQRIAIARALIRRPAILIMDEATSHLDVLTEQRVIGNLESLVATCITIAHRISSVRTADRIIVMRDGRIVETGTHDALMALGGEYTSLVSNQHDRGHDPNSMCEAFTMADRTSAAATASTGTII